VQVVIPLPSPKNGCYTRFVSNPAQSFLFCVARPLLGTPPPSAVLSFSPERHLFTRHLSCRSFFKRSSRVCYFPKNSGTPPHIGSSFLWASSPPPCFLYLFGSYFSFILIPRVAFFSGSFFSSWLSRSHSQARHTTTPQPVPDTGGLGDDFLFPSQLFCVLCVSPPSPYNPVLPRPLARCIITHTFFIPPL